MSLSRRRRGDPTLVITRIGGQFGRLLARELHRDHRIIGIDPRGARHMPKDVTVHALDIRRKRTEDIFRRNRIDAVIHMNPGPEWVRDARAHRAQTVLGTTRVLQFCAKYDVPKAVILSTASLYGPSPSNHQFLTERSPLLAGRDFQAMRDLVEADMYANSFFWEQPEVDTVILRPVHVVGRLHNAASRYLMLKRVPTLLGFDPMVQVMSPDDLVSAIRRALKPGVRGVFNLAGPQALPLTALIRRIGRSRLPLPESMLRAALGVLWGTGVSAVPSAIADYLKYVCMVDDSRARKILGYEPALDLDRTLAPLRGG